MAKRLPVIDINSIHTFVINLLGFLRENTSILDWKTIVTVSITYYIII
jgi:hypothetical protein